MGKYKPLFLDQKRIHQRIVCSLMPQVIKTKGSKKVEASSKVVYAFDIAEHARLRKIEDILFRDLGMAPVIKHKPVRYNYKESVENKYAYNPPYGVIPQLAELSTEELKKLADKFSILKFQYMERGDYLRSFLFGWRQRLIERVINGNATIQVVTEQ
jgi:hypothetical protein